jgi:hypothetical protein
VNAKFRKLEDLHNELAHARLFPKAYGSHTAALARRVAITTQIRELLRSIP